MTDQNLPLVAKLIPPRSDKNWSVQALHISKEQIDEVYSKFPEFKNTLPFLQGRQDGEWMMVEFWTDNNASIRRAAQIIFDTLKVSFVEVVAGEEAFTQEEVFGTN